MKRIKLSKVDPKIDRKVISHVGEAIYRSEGIRAVKIKVDFKDGTVIGFNRSENKDEIDRFMERDNDD